MHSYKTSTSSVWLNVLALLAASLAIAALTWKNSQASAPKVLLTANCNPSRELQRDLNPAFTNGYATNAGVHVAMEEVQPDSAVPNADVVTTALPSEIDALQRKGLIAPGWSSRLPGSSQAYSSTIVFVVKRGNPKGIQDWPDLVRKNVAVTLDQSKMSDEAKVSVLAAWGSIVQRGGSDASALAYLKHLYAHCSKKGAASDVHVTWENAALLETARSHGDSQIVYPPISIRAEPAVAWVDSVVARHHSEASAKAYAQFLFTAPAQEIMAQHGYRPVDPAVFQKHASQFPAMNLFPVTAVAKNWDDAESRFFAVGGLSDQARSAVRD